jgi:hypothetical protein
MMRTARHLAAIALLFSSAGAGAEPLDLAIVGDSLSTGAATHPALTFDAKALWAVFNGQTSVLPRRADLPADLAGPLPDPPPPPVRLWPTPREFFGGPDWVWRNALQSLSRSYLDTAQYSWGYLLGAGLGVSPGRIALAGEDGARYANMTRQLDRVLDYAGGVLPRRLAVLYTGNDLCGAGLSALTEASELQNDLRTGLNYLARNGTPPSGGTDVYVLSYLGVLQLLTEKSILAKEVHAFGGVMTCRELREAAFRPPAPAALKSTSPEGPAAAGDMPLFFQMFMPPNPAAFCPTLFGAPDENGELVHALANRIRAFRVAQEEAVAAADRAAPAGVRIHLVRATADVAFTGEDIAPDCFHLALPGQAKVARAALAAVRSAEGLR